MLKGVLSEYEILSQYLDETRGLSRCILLAPCSSDIEPQATRGFNLYSWNQRLHGSDAFRILLVERQKNWSISSSQAAVHAGFAQLQQLGPADEEKRSLCDWVIPKTQQIQTGKRGFTLAFGGMHLKIWQQKWLWETSRTTRVGFKAFAFLGIGHIWQ